MEMPQAKSKEEVVTFREEAQYRLSLALGAYV